MSPILADAIFWIAVVSCAVAQFFIVRSTFRSSRQARTSEVLWAALPAVALVLVFVFTWRELHPGAPTAPPSLTSGQVSS